MYGWNSKSMKTKNYVRNYTRYTVLKNNFLWFTLGPMRVFTLMTYENIKIKLWSIINILKPAHCRNFYLQKETDCKV